MSEVSVIRNTTKFLFSLLLFFSVNLLLAQHSHNKNYTEPSLQKNLSTIYLAQNKPMSIGCPNAGFEQYDFSNWTGSTGTVSIGSSAPVYNNTGISIINTAGSNVSLLNQVNYHTIMTIPSSNAFYPSCVGYDSLACKAIGSQTISEIPYKNPYSFDPVSVRMNGAVPNKRACKLKFISTVGASSKRLSYSFALVFQNPTGTSNPELQGEAPYFKVTLRNETTNTDLPSCFSYSFSPVGAQASDSLLNSVTASGIPVVYRKWKYYSIDLSSLPIGTNVSINFEVGGCSNGDHFGYAYVDAECGGVGNAYSSMCSGSSVASLVAPVGFNSYQWSNASGLIPGATNDTLLVSSPVVGSTYTVSMVSPGGCVITQTVSINLTTVNIINLNSTSSCTDGNSGTAFVEANGSSGAYTYTWTSTSGPLQGTNVSFSQIATGLAPGTYSVAVASTNCGQSSANLSVGLSPPYYNSLLKQFCGNAAIISNPGGSNYKWYKGAVAIPLPMGVSDPLFISNAVNGDNYTLVYKNSSGCRDSIKYVLQQVEGGSSYFSNLNNVCQNSNNGSVVLNLNSPNPGPFGYLISGPNATDTIINAITGIKTITVSFLTAGTYTAIITDGPCVYNNTVTVNTVPNNFTVTTTNTVICFPSEKAVFNLNIDEPVPSSCSVYPSVCSGNTPIDLFASGTFTQNSSTTYPTSYGNSLKCGRTQFLIHKSELNAAGIFAGKISSLAFNVLNMNSSVTTYTNFSIKMGCSGFNSLPDVSGGAQSFIPDLHTVYFNPGQQITLGWLTHNFNQSYLWDGISNIIVEICYGTPSQSATTENISIQLKQMGYVSTMYHTENASEVCGGIQLADNGVGAAMPNAKNMLPNMQFGYCAYSTPSQNYTVSVSTNGTITANYSNDSIQIVPTFTAPPSPNAQTVYTITITNPDGVCTSSHTIAVLYPALNVSITATPMSDTLCQGESATFNVSGASSYDWTYDQGGVPVSFSTSNSVTVTPATGGISTYSVTGSNPCPNSISQVKVVTVTVTPKATLVILPIQDQIKCMNKGAILNANVNSLTPGNNGTPYTFAWTTLPGNIPASGPNTSPSYTATANTTETFVVTVDGNCAFTSTDTVVVKNLVNDLSIIITDTSTTCAGKPFTLNAIASGGYPAYEYAWFIYPNSNIISSTSSLSYTSPDAEGSYTVSVFVGDSCGYSGSDFELINVLPPCVVTIPNVFTPNGDNANEFFKIKNIEHHPNTSLTIFDRWGKKIYENNDYNNEWKAEGVADGTYFYIVDVPEDKKYTGFVTVFKGN